MSVYAIDYRTKDTLFNWLDISRPGLEELDKVALLRSCYQPLRLHELPLSVSIFIFDTAMRSVQAGLKLKEIADKHLHWHELILARIELIGYDNLLELLKFIKPFEEAEHVKQRDGQGRQERSQRQAGA